LAKFEEKAKQSGRRITNSKTASKSDDWKTMVNTGFWFGACKAEEFHGPNAFVDHLCGRGREVSMLRPEDLCISDANEETQK